MFKPWNRIGGANRPLAAQALIVALLLAAVGVSPASAQLETPTTSTEKPLPKFETVANSVRRDFSAHSYYKPGDIISKSEVEAAIDHLKLLGWTPPDIRDVLAKVPGDKDYLVRQLRTDNGFQFMRSVSKWSASYDRLDRLVALPNGMRMLHDMINDVGGDELVDYLINTEGGDNLGVQLTRAPGGADFNKPTGKLYTVDQLIDRLKISYEKTLEMRRKEAERNDAS